MSSEAEVVPALFSDLMSSQCDGDRAKSKARFEQQCGVLEAKVNHLMTANIKSLSGIVETAGRAIQVVSDSKFKCGVLKLRLTSCMEILLSKRDDLRSLWLESLQQKYAHEILEDIEETRKVPETVNKYLLEKKYHEATEVLVSSIDMIERELNNIEVLKEQKVELYRLQDKLYSIFLEALVQELYMSSFHSIYQGKCDVNFEDVTYEKMFNCRMLKDGKSIDFNISYVMTLLECVALMGKIPEILEIFKEDCQAELMKIVKKLSKLMFDILQRSTDTPLLELPNSQGELFLSDLLNTIIGHFRQILINNKIFLHILGKILAANGIEDPCFEMMDMYSNVQSVVEYFASCYLEVQPSTNLPRQKISVFSGTEIVDISGFFVPKSYLEGKCQLMFKFRNSLQGMSGNRKRASYDFFQKDREGFKDRMPENDLRKLVLVCKPSQKNITVMFGPLKNFALEIEKNLEVESLAHCPLHVFIYDSANNFLDQVNSEINRILENASFNLESWSVSTVPDDSLERSSSEMQVLSSTLILNDNLKELKMILSNLPDYSNHFLQLIYYVILDYKDLVQKTFKSLFGEEHNILSVTWAKDRDIGRLLKSFSNWKFLSVSSSGEMMESPEDVRLRNKEESELLIRNLNSEEQATWDIIRDETVLFNLAILQESLQWFSTQLMNFVDDFKSCEELLTEAPKGPSKLPKLNAAASLQKLIKDYEDFSDVCLLALHLEVRAHCFHHLLSSKENDIEIYVNNLTEDLIKIDETLIPALTAKELKYIFEGLGELVASILINNIGDLEKVNEALVKKMHRSIFNVQCCLASITTAREVSLERVRLYIQLLNQTCDEILNEIVEEGPKFKESEYASIFRLVLGKEDADPQLLIGYTEKLSDTLKSIK